MLGACVICFLACLLTHRACADMNHTQGKTAEQPFSCKGRPPGYYADVASDCQRYHLCDDGGRRFTHSCPDMTRFQQRMMVCDHWYAVDCSVAESDFGANLLIGRRDQPFLDHVHHAPGRRRVLHRGYRVETTVPPKFPPEQESSTAEQQEPRITFRYVEATSPSSRNRNKGGRQLAITTESPVDNRQQPSVVSVHFGTRRRVALPQEYSSNVFLQSFVDTLEDGAQISTESTTTLAAVTNNIFLAPLFSKQTTTTPPVTPDAREYVEVRLSDPRLMFFIPESGDENDLEPDRNSTVVIHLDHHHTAMTFRPGGRVLPEGRNPQCPNCLPAFLAPGRCQPCVTLR